MPSEVGMMRATGRRLRALRETKGLTQTDFAKLIHSSQSTVARWEQGMAFPDPHSMAWVAQRCQVTLDYIYLGRLDGIAAANA
jgi:transcriptional regulator with XRE-family HTH domain